MEELQHIAPTAIGKNHIDIQQILKKKNVHLPDWAVQLLARLLHQQDINNAIYHHRDKTGVDFVKAFLSGTEPYDLDCHIDVTGSENIPLQGNPIFVGNHPLGGPDGMALIAAIGDYRRDIRFPVNDFLMHIPALAPLFIPIDKVKNIKTPEDRAKLQANITRLEGAFSDDNALLYFPAGICSRKQRGGIIRDLEWKPTFVKKAVRYHRDIVPFFFDACNRKRFYNLARLRERLGIKFNFEMALLPGELYAQRGKHLHLIIGKPIPYTLLDKRLRPEEWAQRLKDHCYRLKDNPTLAFTI